MDEITIMKLFWSTDPTLQSFLIHTSIGLLLQQISEEYIEERHLPGEKEEVSPSKSGEPKRTFHPCELIKTVESKPHLFFPQKGLILSYFILFRNNLSVVHYEMR
jgi:hypothetical protein